MYSPKIAEHLIPPIYWLARARGQHMTPPDLFYFSRHRGWYLAFPWVTVAEIRALRQKGAAYLVISRDLADDVRTFRRERPDLVEAFGRDYAKVVDRPDLLIYDLGTR